MKKILLTILIIIAGLQTYAFEDYIITSDCKVEAVYSKDENIVSLSPIFTIDNNKNTILLKAKNVGKSSVVITTKDGDTEIEVDVKESKTILSDVEGFNYFVFDFPRGGK